MHTALLGLLQAAAHSFVGGASCTRHTGTLCWPSNYLRLPRCVPRPVPAPTQVLSNADARANYNAQLEVALQVGMDAHRLGSILGSRLCIPPSLVCSCHLGLCGSQTGFVRQADEDTACMSWGPHLRVKLSLCRV